LAPIVSIWDLASWKDGSYLMLQLSFLNICILIEDRPTDCLLPVALRRLEQVCWKLPKLRMDEAQVPAVRSSQTVVRIFRTILFNFVPEVDNSSSVRNDKSDADFAMPSMLSSDAVNVKTPSVDNLPCVGLKACRDGLIAGVIIDPSVSVSIDSRRDLAATATAEPLEDPPAFWNPARVS